MHRFKRPNKNLKAQNTYQVLEVIHSSSEDLSFTVRWVFNSKQHSILWLLASNINALLIRYFCHFSAKKLNWTAESDKPEDQLNAEMQEKHAKLNICISSLRRYCNLAFLQLHWKHKLIYRKRCVKDVMENPRIWCFENNAVLCKEKVWL